MNDAARGHSTATLLEAAGGDVDLDPGIRPAWTGASVSGPAYTVAGAGRDNLALHLAVAEAPPGVVLVVDVHGAPYGHWGEILAVAAIARGILGLIIDGGVRDTVELHRLGFPVFSRGIAIAGTGKKVAGARGTTATVGGRRVTTGDLVAADQDGVVAIPAERAHTVLDAADRRVREETVILAKLRAGARTLDLYAFGQDFR